MNDLITSLARRYELANDSSNSSDFYLNVYRYINFINTTPALQHIVDAEDLRMNKFEVDTQDSPLINEEKKHTIISTTYRLSLSSSYWLLFINIHRYIYWYEHLDDREQDALGIILVEGPDNGRLKKLNKIDRHTYTRDFTSEKVDAYRAALRQLHFRMIEILEKSPEPDPISHSPEHKKKSEPKEQLPLSLDPITGDFTYYTAKGNFPINGQEFKILHALLTSEKYVADYITLLQAIYPDTTTIKKTAKYKLQTIIGNIKEKLGILRESSTRNPDIFVNIKGHGYRLIFSQTATNTE